MGAWDACPGVGGEIPEALQKLDPHILELVCSEILDRRRWGLLMIGPFLFSRLWCMRCCDTSFNMLLGCCEAMLGQLIVHPCTHLLSACGGCSSKAKENKY